MLAINSEVIVEYRHRIGGDIEKKIRDYAKEHCLSFKEAVIEMQDNQIIDIYNYVTKVKMADRNIYALDIVEE